MTMNYTVKQLSKLAGVSPRTLRYYDSIGLLRPARQRDNDYRLYDEPGLLRLQQILFYRELGFPLEQIRDILDRPDFDLPAALRAHRVALLEQAARLQTLVRTVERTLDHIERKTEMSKKQLFEGFSEAQQEEYARQAGERWDKATVEQSQRLWKSYSKEQKQQVLDEGKAIYTGLIDQIGADPASPAVQALIGRWHQHLRSFYEPTLEILRNLPDLYVNDPAFRANFDAMHPQLAEFVRAAVTIYVDGLESA
jgi:DNA-binding transcriptional MerR regulator